MNSARTIIDEHGRRRELRPLADGAPATGGIAEEAAEPSEGELLLAAYELIRAAARRKAAGQRGNDAPAEARRPIW